MKPINILYLFVVVLAITAFALSCAPDTSELRNNIKERMEDAGDTERLYYKDLRAKVQKIEIDGCEFILASSSSGSDVEIIHKPKCKNHD